MMGKAFMRQDTHTAAGARKNSDLSDAPSRVLRAARPGERGIALILVMFVIATLSILVLEFIHSTRINLYIAGNIADGAKAFYLARSGITVAAGAMLQDAQDKNKEDHLWEAWANPLPALPAGEGWVTVEIVDEDSKFNLNKLVRKSGLPDSVRRDVFEKLLTSLELDPELAKPVIDWIDKDTESQNGGDEDSIYGYSAQVDPYPSRNGPFLSLNELTLVNGMTDEIYKKLMPYVTVYGDEKLNLNTVNEKVLTAYVQSLSGEQDASPTVQKIISWRGIEGNYFAEKTVKQQLVNEAQIDSELAGKLTKLFGVSSSFFSVTATAQVADSTKKCLGVIFRSKAKVRIVYFRLV